MIRRLMGAPGVAALFATAAAAQPPSLQPQSGAIVAPVVPPGTLVAQMGSETFVGTPVPGVAATSRVKVQRFGDNDANGDGAPQMEFAEAVCFLATTDPVAGNPKLPGWGRYTHRGAAQRMTPSDAITLLNATGDEFAFTDTDNDWRVSPQELNRLAML